ncbi:MAG: phosphoribosylaminoimidazolesuccinocarboxamide synthase [Firmicutes bacterium]|nr:phosphoribosylaminoimidazolesuccinocarboxamide synthase [Bacillota bacterium]
MKLLCDGKTKAVFEAGPGEILLKFKDQVTGSEGVADPGGNVVIGSLAGKGGASLRLSRYFFQLLERRAIPTHYLKSDLSANTMLVKRAETFGRGLEFICRLKAAGSFLRRYGQYVREGEPLDYLVEVTLKDDQRGDPLINEEALLRLRLITPGELARAVELTGQVTRLVEQECRRAGLELIDIKLEFGRLGRQVVVIDEISGDNMRVYKDGKALDQKQLCATICG